MLKARSQQSQGSFSEVRNIIAFDEGSEDSVSTVITLYLARASNQQTSNSLAKVVHKNGYDIVLEQVMTKI